MGEGRPPLGTTLWAAFEAHSSSPALWISGTCHSYREVFQAASALAGLIEDRTEPGARVGILAQRAKSRPNRIGVTLCELVSVDGLALRVRGLDAIDGTPVLDVKPYFSAFGPRGRVREPTWVHELMRDYW